jgi:predicted PurR-regulated permease PerM
MLSNFQKRIVSAGGTALASIVLIATIFFLFLLLQRFIGSFQSVLLPLAIAAILATLLRPIIAWSETYTRLNRLSGIIILYLVIIALLFITAFFCLPTILEQAGDFLHAAPGLFEKLLNYLQTAAPKIWHWLELQLGQTPDSYLQNHLSQNSEVLQKSLGTLQSSAGSMFAFIGSTLGSIAAYSIIPVYVFFILNAQRDVWQNISHQLKFLPQDRREDLIFLARQFSEILTAFFRGQIIIGLLLGLFLAMGFALLGLKFGILLGLILGLLNIIPYLGTMLGILTVLPLAYLQQDGGSQLMLYCALVFTVGQLLTDYLFTPRIMGEKTGMGPMLIIFSVFFWGTALSGILGMILAIPLTAFFLVFWRLARDKYLPALAEK